MTNARTTKTIETNSSFALFETQRLLARRIQLADFDDIYSLDNNPRVIETLGGPKTAAQVQTALGKVVEQWQIYGYCYWIFFSKDRGKFVGRGGLRHVQILEKDEVEIGYALMPEFWGQGLAMEIGKAAIRVAKAVGLQELVCFTLPTNKASKRVMEKLGFIYERDFVYSNFPHVLYRLQLNKETALA